MKQTATRTGTVWLLAILWLSAACGGTQSAKPAAEPTASGDGAESASPAAPAGVAPAPEKPESATPPVATEARGDSRGDSKPAPEASATPPGGKEGVTYSKTVTVKTELEFRYRPAKGAWALWNPDGHFLGPDWVANRKQLEEFARLHKNASVMVPLQKVCDLAGANPGTARFAVQVRGFEGTFEESHIACLKDLNIDYLTIDLEYAGSLKALNALVGLRGLHLSADGIGDRMLRDVSALQQLRELQLAYSGITDASLKEIAKLPNLEKLSVQGASITNAGMRTIGTMSQLRDLNVSKTRITDRGLKHLSKLKELRVLGLWKTNVTDKGMRYVGKLKKLQQLYIEDTQVTEEGRDKLIDRLPDVDLL